MDFFVQQPTTIFECRNPTHATMRSMTQNYGVMRFCTDESCRIKFKEKRRWRFVFCTFCQKYGHTHRNCFVKRRAKRSYQRATLQCRRCDQFGHAHYECPYHHQIMLFMTELLMPFQHHVYSGESWVDGKSSWRKLSSQSNKPVDLPSRRTALKRGDENSVEKVSSNSASSQANSPTKPFPAPIPSRCNHCFQKFSSRNKLFRHLKSDCILAEDDPDVGSVIKSKALAKILEEENLGKWDPETINLDSVAKLPSWCEEPIDATSSDAFQKKLNRWNFTDRVRSRLKKIKIPFVKMKSSAARTEELLRRSKLSGPETIQRLPD